MILNPYRFAAAGNAASSPLHYWDLTDLTATSGGGVYDQGSASWGALTESTTTPTVDTTSAPDGVKSALGFSGAGRYLYDAAQTWDGANNDSASMSLWIELPSTLPNFAARFLDWRGGTRTVSPYFMRIVADNDNPDPFKAQFFDSDGDFVNAEGDATEASTWFHLVATYSSGGAKLYVNKQGESFNSTPITTTGSGGVWGVFDTTGTAPFALATNADDLGAAAVGHDGRLFGCGIYDVELDATDVEFLWNSGDGRIFSEL